jgi:uncharacterized protein YbaR (Trm112 family)
MTKDVSAVGDFLDLLGCPGRQRTLELRGADWLIRVECQREYPILGGIPRLLSDGLLLQMFPAVAPRLTATRPQLLEPVGRERRNTGDGGILWF